MNKQNINTWLNTKIDDREYHYDIILELCNELENGIKSMDLEINDINKLKKEFIYFLYLNSSRRKYK